MMELSVILPVYNEKGTVLEILERVRAVPIDKEIIIVDNCSTDGTRELIQEVRQPEVRVILQPANMQKGNSVKRGIGEARGEFMVIQDADLEYDPQDHVPMLAEVKRDGVLAALGSRILGARECGERLPTSVFSLGRGLLTRAFRLLYGVALTDIATCYKMMRTEVARSLQLQSDGFDLDFEIAGKLARLAKRRGLRIAEVPIHYAPRTVAEGKKITWRDGFTSLGAIWRYRGWEPPPVEGGNR
jgi:dolichol-phosphate mannosyltransferase